MRFETGDAAAVEPDVARCGTEETRYQVEYRGLPRSVRPDEAEDLPCLDIEGEVRNGAKAAEITGQTGNLK
jgi:hypothetical protein